MGRRRGQRDAEVTRGAELLAQGRAEEAEHLLGDLARSRAARHGAAARTIEARKAHGAALLALDRPAEAAATFGTLVAECRQVYGATAYQVFAAALRVSEARLAAGQYADAESQARTVVAEATGPGLNDGVSLRLRYVGRLLIGEAMAASGRHAEALDWFDRMAPAAARDLGAEHVSALAARFGRVLQLHMLGRAGEAREAAASLVAATSRMGEDWPATAAAALVLTSEPAAAEAAGRAALAAHEARLGAGQVRVQAVRAHLTSALTALGRHEEALALLASMPVVVPDLRPVWALIRAEALHAAGHRDAPTVAAEAVARCSSRYAPAHYGTLSARTVLAAVSGTREDRAGLADLWETHFGAGHPRTLAARRAAG